jgi:hypothetical protein
MSNSFAPMCGQADVHDLNSAKREKKEQPIVDQLEQEAMKSKTVLAECSFRFEICIIVDNLQ